MASSCSSEIDQSSVLCPITLTLLDNPVTLCCGHTFSSTALSQWLVETPKCPTCRKPAARRQCLVSIAFRDFLEQIFPGSQSKTIPPTIVTQVSDDSLDMDVVIDGDLWSDVVVNSNDFPFSAPLNHQVFDEYTDDSDVPPLVREFLPARPSPLMSITARLNDFIDFDRTIDLFRRTPSHYINPNSSNFTTLSIEALAPNRSFYERRHMTGDIVYFKYIYHFNGSLVEAIRRAVFNGYYVYDMFALGNRFVLYSVCFKRDGFVHSLESFRG